VDHQDNAGDLQTHEAVEKESNRMAKGKDDSFYMLEFNGEELFVRDTTQLATADGLP
jgi:hypothetical protein